MKRAGRAKCSLSLHGWSSSEHRGEKWQLNCKRTERHSLTLDILFGQDLCLWHHLTSWMDQDSLVVRSSHSIPILEATIYPATACVNHFLEKTDRTENGERHSLNPKTLPFSFVPWSPAIILLLCFGSLLKRTKDKDKRGAMGSIFRYYLKGAKCPLFWNDFDF